MTRCKHGHAAGRYENGRCKECVRLLNVSNQNAGRYQKRLLKYGAAELAKQGREYYKKRRAIALIKGAQRRAIVKKVAFNLDKHKAHYINIIENGVCQITGLPFTSEISSKERVSPFAPSLDRIRPELGYVHGNVRVIIWALNTGFSDWGIDVYALVAKSFFKNNPWIAPP